MPGHVGLWQRRRPEAEHAHCTGCKKQEESGVDAFVSGKKEVEKFGFEAGRVSSQGHGKKAHGYTGAASRRRRRSRRSE